VICQGIGNISDFIPSPCPIFPTDVLPHTQTAYRLVIIDGEWCVLKSNIEQRACDLAVYIIENKATVRTAAKEFGISKSTVHKDLSERLEQFNRPLYLQVKEVLDENKAERHIRGGIATRIKYKGE